MNFRTEYKAARREIILDPRKPAVLVGSCFSQNIASKMEKCDWQSVNPCGTLYNPLSISIAIDLMCKEGDGVKEFEKTLFHSGGLWNSHLFDSSFSAIAKEDCIEEFCHRQQLLLDALGREGVLIVTFGTSICYFLSEDERPVGNCHKEPQNIFYRRRLSVEEIVAGWNERIKELQVRFPGIKIIFTVSPVRHLKDGFEGNTRSKAILCLALEEICRGNDACIYFPAFEIMNDDLRDYRFYASDLVHPSEEAIDYIWEKFKAEFIDSEGERILADGERKYKASHHRGKTGALGKLLHP